MFAVVIAGIEPVIEQALQLTGRHGQFEDLLFGIWFAFLFQPLGKAFARLDHLPVCHAVADIGGQQLDQAVAQGAKKALYVRFLPPGIGIGAADVHAEQGTDGHDPLAHVVRAVIGAHHAVIVEGAPGQQGLAQQQADPLAR